jgi:hypothetical protein
VRYVQNGDEPEGFAGHEALAVFIGPASAAQNLELIVVARL